jgi:hypothetical protein
MKRFAAVYDRSTSMNSEAIHRIAAMLIPELFLEVTKNIRESVRMLLGSDLREGRASRG